MNFLVIPVILGGAYLYAYSPSKQQQIEKEPEIHHMMLGRDYVDNLYMAVAGTKGRMDNKHLHLDHNQIIHDTFEPLQDKVPNYISDLPIDNKRKDLMIEGPNDDRHQAQLHGDLKQNEQQMLHPTANKHLAIRKVQDKPLIAHCQQPKPRNIPKQITRSHDIHFPGF